MSFVTLGHKILLLGKDAKLIAPNKIVGKE
jgi:hypothetical protein